MINLYRTITNIISPLIIALLYWRRFIGKEDAIRLPERFGQASVARPQGKLLWFHAASVGEANSIILLIESILKKFPEVNILVTTGTVTSAKIITAKLPRNVIHQYIPVDLNFAVKKFIDHWHPNLAFWVESELWPNLISATYRSGAKMILLNSRISERSYKFWLYFKTLAKEMLKCFDCCLPQTFTDFERLEVLGASNIQLIGNLKFTGEALTADSKEFMKLIKQTQGRKIFLAASTHKGEEKIIAEIHKGLNMEELLTIIVPRHAARGSEVRMELPDLKVSQRSKQEEITKDTAIYLADTMAELGIFYRLADLIFMGGSLIKHGGQNPLEPARLEKAGITGPHYSNFEAIYNEMKEKNAVIIVKNEEELYDNVKELLADDEKRKQLALNAYEYVRKKSGILDEYMAEIGKYVRSC